MPNTFSILDFTVPVILWEEFKFCRFFYAWSLLNPTQTRKWPQTQMQVKMWQAVTALFQKLKFTYNYFASSRLTHCIWFCSLKMHITHFFHNICKVFSKRVHLINMSFINNQSWPQTSNKSFQIWRYCVYETHIGMNSKNTESIHTDVTNLTLV